MIDFIYLNKWRFFEFISKRNEQNIKIRVFFNVLPITLNLTFMFARSLKSIFNCIRHTFEVSKGSKLNIFSSLKYQSKEIKHSILHVFPFGYGNFQAEDPYPVNKSVNVLVLSLWYDTDKPCGRGIFVSLT